MTESRNQPKKLWMVQHRMFESMGPLISQVLTSLIAGGVLGFTSALIAISLAVLAFSDAPAGYLVVGIGYFLFGALVISLVTSLASSFPNSVAIPQDTPSVLLALMAGSIASQMSGAAPEEIFYTVVVSMAVASVLMGLLLTLLGTFKLGSLIRYVPYPVIGGFLAGTGWLLTNGAAGVMLGSSIASIDLFSLFQAEILPRWLPGLVLAVALLLLLRRYRHPMLLPGVLVGATLLFYLALFLSGSSVATASAQGWLLGPFPSGGLWQPLTLSTLSLVDWGVILAQSATIGTLLLISLLALLLNASGMELAARQDMNLNRELRIVGLANGLSGLGGGPVGYHSLSLSVLSHRMIPQNRAVGVIVALLCGFTLVAGASILSYFPSFLLGGLLLLLGLDFLVTWVSDVRFKLSRAEYAIVLSILLVISTLGVMEGVALGILLAMVLFVIEYSRISAVKHTLSGASYRSKVDRPHSHRQFLRQQGDLLYILELQGYLFFGTANRVLEQVRQRLHNRSLPAPHFVVLDFRQAHSLDASATLSMIKLKQLAQSHGFALIFTNLTPDMRRQLAPELFSQADSNLCYTFPDLDHALERCEEQILAEKGEAGASGAAVDDSDLDAFSRLQAELASKERKGAASGKRSKTMDLMKYVERVEVPSGAFLIRQGDAPKGIYFIESGQITAQLTLNDGQTLRLRTMCPGTIIGELGLYANTMASASVVAMELSTVYFLSGEHLGQMEQDEPEMAAVVHRYIAQLASERLLDATHTIRALLS
jgi:sulfate permease, SulP family